MCIRDRVYRKSVGSLVFSIDITLVKGTNKIFFAEHPILAGDVVVLFLIESNIIEVVEKQGNMINFFEEETFNTGSGSLTFYNVAFKARVFAVISTKFKYEINGLIDNELQHPINWIAFSGLTANGQEIKSNNKDLIFPDISSTVNFVNVNLTAIANQAYTVSYTHLTLPTIYSV